MKLIKVTILLSCLIALVNGVHVSRYEHVGSHKMRVKRRPLEVPLTDPATALQEERAASREISVSEAKDVVKDEVKEVDKLDGEEKHLGIIKNPFQAISSIFKKKPEPEHNNYGNGNHHSTYHSNPNHHVQAVQVPIHNTPINPQVDIYNKPQNDVLNQNHQASFQIYPLQTGSISSSPNQHQVAYDGGFHQNPHSPGNVYPLQSTAESSTLNRPPQNVYTQNKPHQHQHFLSKPQTSNYQKPYIGDFIPIKTKPQATQKPNIHDIVFFPQEPNEPTKPHDSYFSQIAQLHGNKPGLFSKPQKPIKPNYQSGSSHQDQQYGSKPCENKPIIKPNSWPQTQKPTAPGPGHYTNTNNNHGSNYQITTASGTKPVQTSDSFQKPGSNSQPNEKPFFGSLFQKPNKPTGNQQSQKPLFGSLNKPQSSVLIKPSHGQIGYPVQGTTQQLFGPTYQNPYYRYGPHLEYQGFHQNAWTNNYNQYQSPHYIDQFQPAYYPQYNPYYGYIQQSKPDSYFNNQKPSTTKKPMTTQTSFQGHTTLTRKQFLSLFKPIMALASVLKKPIILEPVINEQPHDGDNFGNFGPQQYPGKPSNQGYQSYITPSDNNPNFLKPQKGSWEMIRGHVGSLATGSLGMAFGPIGPVVSSFSRPYLSQAVHGLSSGYLAKDVNLEPEITSIYMIDDEDESQRQEYPVLLPLELLDGISIVDDDDEAVASNTESRTIVKSNTDVSQLIETQRSIGVETAGNAAVEGKEDESERQGNPRVPTLEVLDVISITDDGDAKATAPRTESRTVVQPDTDASKFIDFQRSFDDLAENITNVKDELSAKKHKEDETELSSSERELPSEKSNQSVDVNRETLAKELTEISSDSVETKTETSTEGKEDTVKMDNDFIKFGLD